MKVVECVPNFSEGRDRGKVERIASAVTQVPGVKLLDYSSEEAHNRSVVTFLGEPGAVREAALRCCLEALELIDMRVHKGAHPRIGAVDVVPFIPIRSMEMGEAVALSRRFGQELGERGGLPVYFYGESAAAPGRRKLSDIRKGEYEGLTAKLRQAEWRPDAGSSEFNAKSGAAVVGARFPLIAFNVNLQSTDLALAKQLARKIRESSGGIPTVQALGVDLKEKGMVQVSMNLTNFKRASIPTVVSFIGRELSGTGVEIAETELIGLVPLEALEEVARDCLKMTGFTSKQVIETHLLPE
ncbi:MAG: glutamate formimidoyltransferase [Desulfobacteraceae bacterium]|nr:MAG: glutamate formimidoyltransferase [Desulfobacteraceae bacterium]